MANDVQKALQSFNQFESTIGAFTNSIKQTISAFDNLKSIPQVSNQALGTAGGAFSVAGVIEQFGVMKQVIGSVQTVMDAGVLQKLTAMKEMVTRTIPDWLRMNWQIALIGGAIGLVLMFMNHFGISVADVVNMAGQLFSWLFGVINQAVMFVMPIVQGLWDIFLQALPVIGPLMLGVLAAFGAYHGILMAISMYHKIYNGILLAFSGIMKAYQLAVHIARAATIAFNAALRANPITMIVSLIVGLIVAFFALIAAVKPVREAVANGFRSMATVIARVVGWISEKIVDFLNNNIDSVNAFLDFVSKVTSKIGSWFGADWGFDFRYEKLDSKAVRAQVEKDVTDTFNSVADKIEDFDAKSFLKSHGLDRFSGDGKIAYDAEMTDAPAIPAANPLTDMNQWNAPAQQAEIATVHEVGKIGRIEDSVDVSSEDLKTMRELAEIRSIQNFVTLTPTVQVQTGDIRQDVDVNDMLKKIEQSMAQEIASSARGVYA
ncbi:hypothetical protein ACF3MZ_29150 [Paenibacillaceae bacterium WGS1546]|uniref:hypothetical protein n=1 Tax=Cohnella sp. WGS1546 TaxID=3366810 RepID=UPI00372CF166